MKRLWLVLLGVVFVTCGSSDSLIDSTQYANSADPSFITMYQIDEDGFVKVEIPLAVFGDAEDDTQGAMIDITINDDQVYQGLTASDYLATNVDLVAFYLPYMDDGDMVSFTITLNTGGTVSYSGDVSADADTKAPLEATE